MSETPRRESAVHLLRWGSCFYLVLAIAGVLWLGIRGGAIPRALFFDGRSILTDLAAGTVTAASLVGLWHLARQVLPTANALERNLAKMIGPLTGAEVVAMAVLSGFAEEFFFRGAVQSAWGIVPATAVFAVLHLGPGREYRVWTLFAVVAGAGLGGLMLWRGNLLAPTVAHVAVNLCGLTRLSRLASERTDVRTATTAG